MDDVDSLTFDSILSALYLSLYRKLRVTCSNNLCIGPYPATIKSPNTKPVNRLEFIPKKSLKNMLAKEENTTYTNVTNIKAMLNIKDLNTTALTSIKRYLTIA